jgi:SNF2 family DNA or RNA helicase
MAFAELDGNRIMVQTSWSEKDVVKQVPGSSWQNFEKVWHVPLSWASCLILRGVFGPTLTVGAGLDAWAAEEIRTRVAPSNALRTRHLLAEGEELLDPRLRQFQHLDVEWLLTAGDALLCNDMGTGKTISALTWLRTLHGSGKPVLPALVICPNSVKLNWKKETAGWFPEATPYVVAGTASVKAKVLAAAAADPTALVVVNIEGVRSFGRLAPYGSVRLKKCRECSSTGEEGLTAARCEVHPKILNQIPFRAVVLDEAHRIKEPKSLQTRACWAVMHGPTVEHRLGMTGTPIANHPGELWSVMHGVAPQDFPSRTKFLDRYCLSAWNPYGTLEIVGIQPEHRDEFFRIVDPRVRRMPKELVLPQLPARVRSVRHVEMSPKQAKAYREIETLFITRLGDESLLTAPGNLTKQQRLMQLASSYCTVDATDPEDPATWTVRLTEPSPKVDELLIVMEELGDEPLVVCAESRQLIYLAHDRLEKLGVPHGLITGAQNEFERQRALQAFQEGRTRCLLFTTKAGGTGLTMTRASTIVFLQRSWSMIDNEQSEGRVHRIGSEGHEKINVVDIVTAGTLEATKQIPRLYEKYEQLQTILRDRELLAASGVDTSHLDREYNAVLTSHLGA